MYVQYHEWTSTRRGIGTKCKTVNTSRNVYCKPCVQASEENRYVRNKVQFQGSVMRDMLA